MECKLNPNEAPDGYYAVLKSEAARQAGSNICRACDWRQQCQKRGVDKCIQNHRCTSYEVICNKDGQTVGRKDGCSVVFKKRKKT